jgi:hypothetical protein
MMKAPAREPWAIGQAMESCASVAFLSARDRLKRRAQSEVFFEIGTVKARQPRANFVRCQFLHLGNLGAQHPAPEHG